VGHDQRQLGLSCHRVTHLFLVEPQLFDLMDHPDVTRCDLSSLSVLTDIGAAAAPILRMRARERLGPVIAHTYGASEMGLVRRVMRAGAHNPARGVSSKRGVGAHNPRTTHRYP
jgi:fatty-acyl-CoA synthase